MDGNGLSGALFSKVQQRVLALIFGQPERSFYTSEIIHNVASGTGAVGRELARLQRGGLVMVKRVGNQTHYQANHQSPIFAELRSLVAKTMGLAEPLKESLAPMADRIEAAFVYGSTAKGNDTARSDIDLMVVGDDLTYSDIYAGLQKAEAALGRPINPSFISKADWRRKVVQKNSFAFKINSLPKIFVLGSESDLLP